MILVTQIHENRKTKLARWKLKESVVQVAQWNVHKNHFIIATTWCIHNGIIPLRTPSRRRAAVQPLSAVLRLRSHVQQQSTVVVVVVVVLGIVPPFLPRATEQGIAIIVSYYLLYHRSESASSTLRRTNNGRIFLFHGEQ